MCVGAVAGFASEKRELSLAQGFGFRHAGVSGPLLVEFLHQQAGAGIVDTPEAGNDGSGAFLLREDAEAVHFAAAAGSRAEGGVAGRKREELRVAEIVGGIGAKVREVRRSP